MGRRRGLTPYGKCLYGGVPFFSRSLREPVKNYLADFVRYGGTPPYPLNGQSFFQKILSRQGGGTPPPLTESPLSFSGIFFLKGLKMMFFSLNKVENGPKRPYNGPKRAKNA